ncbi:MAG: transposase, partial [Firmicutes bacterium]|nr:transposase [Bacillota bacterium]
MRLSVSKSKNSTSLYVIQSIYDKGKRTTRVVEKLGTVAELQQ